MPESRPQPSRPQPSRPEPSRPEPAKSAPAKTAGVAPRVGVPALNPKDDDLDSAQAQEKHQRRLALLKRSQDLTQESYDTEVEIRRLENVEAELQRNLNQLEAHREPLDGQRQHLQDEVDTTAKEIAGLRGNIEKLTGQRANLEESVGKRKKERSEHVAALSHFKAEKESLIS